MSNKDKYIAVTVTVARQANFDKAAVEAVLAKLGLKTTQQLAAFSTANDYKDIVAYCLRYVHFGNNYTGIARAARGAQTVTVTIYIAVGIVNQIKTFLGQAVKEIADRAEDASRQVVTGAVNAGDGIGKNNLEALNDFNYGGGRAAKGAFDALTAPAGSERFWNGANDFWGGTKQIGFGLGKIFVQTPVDAGLMFGGRLLSGWQTWWGLEQIGRPLNANERQILAMVFGSSIELDAIRIKEGYAGLASIGADRNEKGERTYFHNNRALTHGNTIYMKGKTPGTAPFLETLVHETTHVWQNQNGGTDYMGEALYAQIFGDGYDYQKGIKEGKTWAMLNPEQQGKLVQDAYAFGYFSGRQWNDPNLPTQAERDALIKYFDNVLPQLRAGRGAT